MKKVDVSKISTEQFNEATNSIDVVSTVEKLKLINDQDKMVAEVVEREIESIAKVTDAAILTIQNGGRVVYIGAGTSGRLGVLDASEMLPTFGESNWFIGIIAGGDKALRNPIENAEDSTTAIIDDLKAISFSSKDMLIGIAASGRTPYVVAGLKYANQIDATTASLSTSKDTEISANASLPIEVVVGPETITGSTRMKSGTAQKLVLNMISTATMVSMGKTYGSWMVDVKATNEKLVERAKAMIKKLTHADDEVVEGLFEESGRNVKVAVVMFYKQITREHAIEVLKNNNDLLRGLI